MDAARTGKTRKLYLDSNEPGSDLLDECHGITFDQLQVKIENVH